MSVSLPHNAVFAHKLKVQMHAICMPHNAMLWVAMGAGHQYTLTFVLRVLIILCPLALLVSWLMTACEDVPPLRGGRRGWETGQEGVGNGAGGGGRRGRRVQEEKRRQIEEQGKE